MAVIVPVIGIMGQDFIIGRLGKAGQQVQNCLLAGASFAIASPRLRRWGLPAGGKPRGFSSQSAAGHCQLNIVLDWSSRGTYKFLRTHIFHVIVRISSNHLAA